MKIKIAFLSLIISFCTFSQDSLLVILPDSTTKMYVQNYHQNLDAYWYDTFVGIIDTATHGKSNFIHFENNNFRFYTKDSPSFERLFFNLQQMTKFKDRKLNFYHIGGSHVQADIYTNVIREDLNNYWENLPGERGWVFPFNLAKTNNPWNYRFYSENNWVGHRSVIKKDTTNYGVMGMAISTTDSLVQIGYEYKATESKPPFNHIRIFHNKGKLPYSITYKVKNAEVERQITDTIIGYTDTYFSKPMIDFQLEIAQIVDSALITIDTLIVNQDTTIQIHYPKEELFIYGFQLRNDLPGISYNTIGVNGAGLYNYLDNIYLEEQLKTFPPDLFVFSVGTNDANVAYSQFKPGDYKKNLENMMKIVLRANPHCAILLTVPNDAYYYRKYPNKNVAREREVIIELAKEYQIPVWDFYGIMGELGSSKTWRLNGLMKADYIHFTKEGYLLKGDLFFEAFLKWVKQMEYFQYNSILKD